ncbi:MAG: hypothetical protein J5938_02730 [Clostridia bacterium]|nr:hypothetical protein [Clostridia bacterium]
MSIHPDTRQGDAFALSLKLPIGGRVLLLFALTLTSFLSGTLPDLFFRLICTSVGVGLLAYYYLCHLSLLPLLCAVPGFLLSCLATGSVLSSLYSLIWIPGGVLLAFLMMRRSSKTLSVLAVSLSFGVPVLLCIAAELAAGGVDLRPESFLVQYRSWFDSIRDSLIQTIEQNLSALPDSAKTLYAGYAQTITQMMNLVKIVLPGLYCALMEGLGYLAVSVLQGAAKVTRRTRIIPPAFFLTLSPITAVLFILSYGIGLFTQSGSVSVFTGVAINLCAMIAPWLFVLGIRSIVRRSKLVSRRLSFAVTVIILVLALFLSPYFCLLLILIDGIGEVFFITRMKNYARSQHPDP